MKQYIKDGIIKYRNQIVLYGTRTITDKDGNERVVKTQTIGPKEEQLLAAGWELYTPPTPTPTPISEEQRELAKVVRARHTKRNDIIAYDSSNEVNCFYINDTPIWLDKATRAGLMLRFNAENEVEHTITSLWYNGEEYTLPLEIAVHMLYEIEVYASNCYDNTQRHLANLAKLTTIEEIESYDYKSGYPEKLRF